MAKPLAFALVTHWIGEAGGYLWRLLAGGAMSGVINRVFKVASDVADIDSPGRSSRFMEIGERIQHWFWGAGSVIADPFLTLFYLLVVSAFVFIGARIFISPGKGGAPREITYESTVRVLCYGLAPSILSTLPMVGWAAAYIYTAIVTIIGTREVYRTTYFRASIVAFFPQVLVMSAVSAVLIAMLVFFFKMFATQF